LVGAFADLGAQLFPRKFFAEPAKRAVPRVHVQLIGIDQGAVDVEDESKHGEQRHVFELIAFRQGNALSSIGNLGEKVGGIAEDGDCTWLRSPSPIIRRSETKHFQSG
jgi:hypothetical protein